MCYPIPRQGFPGGSAGKESACNVGDLEILKSRDIALLTKVRLIKASCVWMWELDQKESWLRTNWCFWTVVLEKTWESLGTARRSNQSNSKGNQSWIFFGRTDTEVEAPILLATWCKELTHWKRPYCWERLKAGGEGEYRGWNSWMVSPTW